MLIYDSGDFVEDHPITFNPICFVTGTTAGIHWIIPGAYLSENFNVSYGLGILNVEKAPLTIKIENKSKVYGIADPDFNYTISGGQLFGSDAITGKAERQAGEPAGTYTIGKGSLSAGTNYNTKFVEGILTIEKADLTIRLNNASKVYGSADPVSLPWQIETGKLYFNDAITGNPMRQAGESAGVYPIGKGNLYAGPSYNTSFVDGTFTVNKAPLTVKANDQVILAGDPLPKITFTCSGFKFNDTQESVFGINGPLYSINPLYSGLAGTYQIMPSATIILNYIITPQSGNLYVNPSGSGAKAIRPVLDCIELLTVPVSGFSYVAHFRYENKNSTNVYIPIGINNQISGKGKFSNVNQPALFLSGGGTFDVLFDGLKISWLVTSIESGRKTSIASDASSSSSRCSSKQTFAIASEIVPEDPSIELVPVVYPVPAIEKVTIESDFITETSRVTLMDLRGSSYPVKKLAQYERHLELDIKNLPAGYFIVVVYNNNQMRQFRILKTK